jgi:diguanylate cyclase (GGDEF)-like protein
MTNKTNQPKPFRNKEHALGLNLVQLKSQITEMDIKTSNLKRELLIARNYIENLEKERDQLREKVTLDDLTKVKNRKGYDLAVENKVSQLPVDGDLRTATSESLGLLMVDADHFKGVNDTYGHEVGDAVLVAIALVLKSSVRSYDEVCRWGGEEFAVILPGINEIGLKKVGEKIRAAVEDLNFGEIPNLQTSISIGGSIQFRQTDTGLFDRADAAMYEAKNNGRNQVVLIGST